MNDDIETIRACVEGAARLGVEPFIDGTAALDRLEAEVRSYQETLKNIEAADWNRLQAEVERLQKLNEYLDTRLQDRMVALEDLGAENERLREENRQLDKMVAMLGASLNKKLMLKRIEEEA